MLKNLQPFITIIQREIDWMINKWVYWFLTIVGPLLGFALVIGIFHQCVVRELPVTVIDKDQTKSSRQIIRMIDATSIAHINSNCANFAEAQNLMFDGKTQSIIVIPENLEQSLYKNERPDVIVYINNANILKGGLLKSGIFKAITTFSSGIKIQTAMKKGENYQKAISQARPVILDTHVLFNPYNNYFYFLATALMPVILIVFALLSAIYSLGNELKNATSEAAMRKANNSIIVLTLGKLLPYTILFFIQALIFNYLIFKYMDMPLTGSYGILLISELLLIIAYQFLAVFLVGIFGNLRLSVSIGSAYSMMALTFSGLTFPEFGMPLIARGFGQLFPLSYWIKVFVGQTLRSDPTSVSLTNMLYLLIFILMGVICLHWLKMKYKHEKYWSKN